MTSQTARLTSSRRNFLRGLGLCAIAPRPAELQKVSPIPNTPPPKFWFGDRVSYLWSDDDNSIIQQSENGNVVGMIWHPLEKCWQYSVIWLDSTIKDYCPKYPIFDEHLSAEEDLRRAYSEGELCKH